ncbi:MAG TPA: extracellular solute-binding protein [Clostridiales bacterium]|nr:extracellular solute-binding protein [Clostridiales bacterium]
MKKKIISILLMASMGLMLMTGCSNNTSKTEADNAGKTETGNSGEMKATTAPAEEDIPNIVVGFSYLEVPTDLAKVEAAINEITKEKIGCTVTLNAYTYGTVSQQTQLALSTPTEQLDALMTRLYGVGIGGFVSKGQLNPLDDLLEQYGQGIVDAVGSDVLDSNRVNGTLYSITPTGEGASQYCLMVRKDILDAVGYGDVTQVNDYSELTDVFDAIKKTYPDLYTVASGAVQSPYTINLPLNIDRLGDKLGVLEDINEPTVSNYYRSDAYKQICKLGREWNEAGYVYPDILTDTSNSGVALMKQGLMASYFTVYKPGAESEAKVSTGHEVTAIKIGDAQAIAGLSWQWTIPTNSVYPDKAMQFLNLLYTDADLVNLISFGIEGDHYKLDENGQVVSSDNTAGYADQKQWETGNYFLAHTFATQPIDLHDQMKAWNASAKKSIACGFSFDSTEVSAEYTAIQSVISEYDTALQWGFVKDIDSKIEEFNKALHDAGLQKYMDAKQQALNEWLEAK